MITDICPILYTNTHVTRAGWYSVKLQREKFQVLKCQSMYAANAKQSIFCYCSLPAASPEKLGYCAIKHEGLLESVNVKCDLSGSFRFSTVFFFFCFFSFILLVIISV